MYITMKNPTNGVVIESTPKFLHRWAELGFVVI